MSKELHQRIDAECRESKRLLLRAWKLGIEVPNDPQWWENDDDMNLEGGVKHDQLDLVRRRWLTEEGKARVTFLIEDAEIKKETAELDRRLKRVSIYAQIASIFIGAIGAIVGFIGAAIGIITVYYSQRR